MATPQPPSASEKVSVWEDFVDIFVTPSDVFARRTGAGIGIPLVVISVLSALLFFATRGMLQPIMDAEYARATARAMAKDPSVTAAQMEQFRGTFEKIFAAIGLIFAPLSIGFTGLVLWLAGKIFGAAESAGDAIMVAMYSYVPRLLSFVAAVVIALVVDPSKLNSAFSATLSVGRLLDPDATPRALFLLAGRVDVFLLWQVALLGWGLSVTGKITRAQGLLAAAIVWLAGSVVIVGLQR